MLLVQLAIEHLPRVIIEPSKLVHVGYDVIEGVVETEARLLLAPSTAKLISILFESIVKLLLYGLVTEPLEKVPG